MIKKIGRYLDIDKDGFIVPDVSNDLIPEKWQKLINEIISFIEKKDVDNIVALYLRGSVPRGLAIDFVSDLDLIFIAKIREQKLREEILDFKKELLEHYPFCTGIEWSIDLVPDMQAEQPTKNDQIFAKLLKTQALYLWGEDIAKAFPKVKPGQQMMSHSFGFIEDWQEFQKLVFAAPTKDRIDRLGLWMGKRILRTAFELATLNKPLFTRDLYLCYETAAAEYPEIDKQLYAVLALSLQQDASIEEMLAIYTPVADFLIQKVKLLPV